MPSANYHTIDLDVTVPKDAERKRKEIADGVILNLAIVDGESVTTSVWFPADKFTPDQAKAWAKAHDYSGTFHKATGETRGQRHAWTIHAEAGDEDGDEPNRSWHTILRKGTTKGQAMSGPKGGIKVTDKMIDEFVSTFSSERAVGIHHNSSRGEDDPRFMLPELSGAYGWIKALRRAGDDLQALIEWTAEGADLIRRGLFRFFSIEARTETNRKSGKDEFVVCGGTLTNDPFFDLPPLELAASVVADYYATEAADSGGIRSSDVSPAETEEDSPMSLKIEELSSLLGETVTEDNAAEMITTRLAAEAAKVTEVETERDTLKAEIQTLKADKATSDETLTELKASVKDLQKDAADNAKRLADERETRILGADLTRGALSKAEAGTADAPGIARKIYRIDASLYAESYGARTDKYVTTGGGDNGNNGGEEDRDDVPETAHIKDPVEAEQYLASLAERDHEFNHEAAVKALNDKFQGEGTRLDTLWKGAY